MSISVHRVINIPLSITITYHGRPLFSIQLSCLVVLDLGSGIKPTVMSWSEITHKFLMFYFMYIWNKTYKILNKLTSWGLCYSNESMWGCVRGGNSQTWGTWGWRGTAKHRGHNPNTTCIFTFHWLIWFQCKSFVHTLSRLCILCNLNINQDKLDKLN